MLLTVIPKLSLFPVLWVCITNMSGRGGGAHWNTGVTHMHKQRNAKNGSFFETEFDSGESRLGVKKCLVT